MPICLQYLKCNKVLVVLVSFIIISELLLFTLLIPSINHLNCIFGKIDDAMDIQISTVTCFSLCGQDYSHTKQDQCCKQDLIQCKSKFKCKDDQLKDLYNEKRIALDDLITEIVIYTLCSFLLTFVVRRRYQKYRLSEHSEEQRRLNSSLISSETYEQPVKKRNRIKYRSFVSDQISNNCPICLGSYQQFKVIKLQCGHIFHNDCIRLWLDGHQNCPNCRCRA